MVLRANVLAKGFSGIRRDDARAPDRAAEPPGASASCRAADRSARAATSRRSRTWRWSSSAKAKRRSADATGPARRATRWRRRVSQPIDARAEGRARAHQRHAAVRGGAALALRRRRAARARGRHRGRAVDRRAARLDPAVRRAHPRRAAAPGQRHSAANIRALLEGSAHQQVARQLRPGPGRLLAALRAAGPRRGARCARVRPRRRSTIEANAATDNPMVFCGRATRSSLAATFTARRSAMAADLLAIALDAARDDQRAAVGSARQSGAERAAGVPDDAQRAAIRLHDGAGDGGGAGVGDQDARPSGERRHDSDIGEPRGPREHEHGRGAEGRARASSSPPRARGRDAVRVPGDRPARAARRRRAALPRVHARARRSCRRSTDDRPPAPDIEAIAASIVDGSLERACGAEVK